MLEEAAIHSDLEADIDIDMSERRLGDVERPEVH